MTVKKHIDKKNRKKITKTDLMHLKKTANALYYAKTKADLKYQLVTARTFDRKKPDYID